MNIKDLSQERALQPSYWGGANNFQLGYFFHKSDTEYSIDCSGEVLLPNSPLPSNTFVKIDNRAEPIPIKGFAPLVYPIKNRLIIQCPADYAEASAQTEPTNRIPLNWILFKSFQEFSRHHHQISLFSPSAFFADIWPHIYFWNIGNAYKIWFVSDVDDEFNQVRVYAYQADKGWGGETMLKDQFNRDLSGEDERYFNSFLYIHQNTGVHIRNLNADSNNKISMYVQIMPSGKFRENIQKHYAIWPVTKAIGAGGAEVYSPFFDCRQYTNGTLLVQGDPTLAGTMNVYAYEANMVGATCRGQIATKVMAANACTALQFKINYNWAQCGFTVPTEAASIKYSVVLERCGSDT